MAAMAQLGDAEKAQYTNWAAAGAGAGITAATPMIGAAAATGIGLAVAGVALALTAIFMRKGPQQKVISTNIVNEIEPQLQANLEGYISGPRTPESQAAALGNFDAAWQYLSSTQACGSPDLGNPGKACLADRTRGGKFDWFARYRDPIAADTPVTGTAAIAAELPGWMLPASLILLGVLL